MTFIEQMHASLDARANEALILEVHGEKLVEFSGRQIKDLVAAARGFLSSRGVAPGDRVALIAHNSARWAAADLAILGAGGIVVPMYDRQAANELAGMLTNCETRLVLVDTPALKESLSAAWPAGKGAIALFDEVFSHAKGETKPLARSGNDRVTMIYTSGTSGEPKGVLYTVDNVDFMLKRTIDGIGSMVGERQGPDRVFHYLPVCFAGSRIQLWSQLARGNPLMFSTDLNNLVKELATAQPHYFLNVPALLERIRLGVSNKLKERGGLAYSLYRHAVEGNERSARGIATLKDKFAREVAKRIVFPKIREQIGKNLEFLICGSAPLSDETQRWFGLVGIPVYQVYGLTETTAIVTMDQKNQARPGYVGKVIDGVEMQVTDEGELICRGPNIFPEYWKRPDATATSIRDGWFHSGDMAEVTGDGYLRIVGRLKDLLVPESGHNVAPGPLEEKLANFMAGAQVMVVGHAKPYLSAIVTGSAAPDAVQTAIDQLNAELPHYRRLRRFFIAPEPFSVENGQLTANQKLKRAAVEKRYAVEIQGMYE
ncbi:MAG: AMP-binding protein [Myxococcales bacterium]